MSIKSGPHDLSGEMYREYDFGDRVYRISDPEKLWISESTHRILDAEGVVHCVRFGAYKSIVLRWYPRDHSKPVQF